MSKRATKGTRRAQKAATRRTIQRAAADCFAERGYGATGIADIAACAGVAHGTFYVHFASKEALLDEMLAEFNETFAQRLKPVLEEASHVSLTQTVAATAGCFLDYWQEHRAFIEAYAQRSAVGLDVNRLRDGINPPMAAMLGSAIRASTPVLSPARLDLVTHALLAMWLRVGLQYLFNDLVSRADAVLTLVEMSVGAVESVIGGATLSKRLTAKHKEVVP